MASVDQEVVLISVAEGSNVGVRPDRLDISTINVTNIVVSGALNSQTLVGSIVTTGAAQSVVGTKTFTDVIITGTLNGAAVSSNGDLISGMSINATPSIILTFAPAAGSVYLITMNAVAANAAGDAGVFMCSVKVKRVGFTVTLSAPFDNWSNIDAALAGTTVAFVVSGIDLTLVATGVAAQTLNWGGVVKNVPLVF